MSSERAELHALIDELPESQVANVIDEMRSRLRPPRLVGARPFAWIGAGPANNGRNDNAEHINELLALGFGR